ncbi:ABC transporter permease [Paenibacillus koleovorans]|uniref:ABC transporter permease n=1 Tax=Paenibacillus koleovorans TaxID=121608 RepID=UPI0013E330B2|nr:ABC-2 family transporter protein [Paenibacillus koleovorans]
MAVFFEFVRKSFQQRFVYRMNSYVAIISTWLGLFIMISVWQALFRGKEAVNGVTFEDILNLVVINTVVGSLLRSRMGQKIGERVADGTISIDLIRPYSFKSYYVADSLGDNLFGFLFSTIPATALAVVIWGFRLPDDPARIGLFLLSLLGGLLLMFQINYMFGLIAIWLKTSWIVNAVTDAAFDLFAGIFVPLWFYPQWLYAIAQCLPFHLVTFRPISIFLGKTTIAGAWLIIGAQAVWMLVLLVIERWMWRRAQVKFDVFGG